MSNKAKWRHGSLSMGDDVYAITAQSYGGLKVGVYDWEARTQADGVPRIWWSPTSSDEMRRMKKDLNRGISLLQPIPDDALENASP